MNDRSEISRFYGLIGLLAVLSGPPAFAEVMDDVAPLQQRWAQVQYQTPEDARAAAFEQLAAQAEQVVAQNKGAPEPLIWQGIILSTWAGAKGGLGALKLCKQAKASFEEAMKIDPSALQGSAYTSLGSLYYQVPGWPVGFGDEDKAEELLKQALALNPDGIDSNYFYGDYLIEQDRYEEAVKVLEHAAAAAPRPGRELADEGRQKEIAAKLALAKAEL
ncbi:MAG TPA: tetratricopeptide repeat protein [Xanthomonadales bacterium]|nr:tetratricopeptide repeat protein [Xanthomonadales bacterium]